MYNIDLSTHTPMMPLVMRGITDQPVPAHAIRRMMTGMVLHDIDARFGVISMGGWGMTETVIPTICSDGLHAWPEQSMGRPIAGVEAAVVDPDSGALCDTDAMGELLIRGVRGVHLFLEYYRNPDANARAFTADGWFRTGDIVRRGADGSLFYCDRDKDMLKVGGENVSATQVEQVILQVSGVHEVAVVAKQDDGLDEVPVAFVIAQAGVDTDALSAEILAHCRRELSKFKVPRAVHYLDDFPRALLGKIAKNRLREIADGTAR